MKQELRIFNIRATHVHKILKSAIPLLPIDIETAPMLSYHWRPGQEYVPHEFNIHPTTILCASYRNPRTGVIETEAIDPRQPRNDRALCGRLHRLLTWAGNNNVVLLYQNGNRFDLPILESRFIKHGLPPLPRLMTIDTLTEARGFGFDYKRLDYLDHFLGGPGKVEHRGFPMWRDIVWEMSPLDQRQKALKEMTTYCEGDILALERVYGKLRRYMKKHPNANLWTAKRSDCPRCGSAHTVYIGKPVFTTTRAYRRMQCQEKDCRHQFRSTRSIKEIRAEVTGDR